jgi:hypothetical protein
MKLLLLSVSLLASAAATSQDTAGLSRAVTHRATPTVSAVNTIKIYRPNLEITGSHLARVEIWIEPTGTGVGEVLVGEAKRATPAGAREQWIFPISSLPGYPHPIMAVNAFAKTYDRKGKEVGRKSLGFSGVGEFNTALYGQVPE